MEGFNKIFCGSDAKNTGVCDCFFDPKLLTGGMLVPKSRVFTSTELFDANIQATLEAMVSTIRKDRGYPMQGWVAVTDSSEEPTNQTFGYGTIEPVKEGHYNLIFEFRKGGLNLSNALRSFNGLTGKYSLLLFESGNNLMGSAKKDANGAQGLAGIPLEVLYTFPWKVNTGAALASYRIQFNFLPQYINELVAFKKVDFSKFVLSELAGLETIQLSYLGGNGTTQVTVGASSDCGSEDLYDTFDDEFAQAAAWKAYDASGNAIVVSSAVKNTTKHGWDLTLASDPSSIGMAAPTVLAAPPINVKGYEADILVLGSGS